MQIIDYTKKLRRFNTLELSVLNALIKEYLEKDSLFDFLKEIDLTNVKVLDMLPIRFGSDHANEMDEFILFNNMNIIYYDGTNNSLRVIYKK